MSGRGDVPVPATRGRRRVTERRQRVLDHVRAHPGLTGPQIAAELDGESRLTVTDADLRWLAMQGLVEAVAIRTDGGAHFNLWHPKTPKRHEHP